MIPLLERRRLLHAAARVEQEAARLSELAAADFAIALEEARAPWRRGRSRAETVLPFLAESARRSLGLTPRPPQLAAALAMAAGRVAWLPAGAGKSLALALAAALHAWAGRPCRVACVSPWPARRDALALAPFYAACGLKSLLLEDREEAGPEEETADVMYAAARLWLARGLRDQLLRGGADDALRLRLRGVATAAPRALLLDDADLTLIEEAVSPLVISAPGQDELLAEAISVARRLADELEEGRDYRHERTRREIHFSEAGRQQLETWSERLPGLWREPERCHDLFRQALGARDLVQPGRHYRVEEGRLVVLDEGIGRLLLSRGWNQGLLQALEARAGLAVSPLNRTLARLSHAGFLRRHAVAAGCGRGHGGAGVLLRRDYGLTCLSLERAAPARFSVRHIHPDREAKFAALAQRARTLAAAGEAALLLFRRQGDLEEMARRLPEAAMYQPEQPAPPAAIALILAQNLRGVAPPGGRLLLLAEPHDLAHADLRLCAGAATEGFLALDDEALQQHLPRLSALAARRGWLLLGTPLLTLAQFLAARTARKQGKLLRRREAQVRQQLAFTGAQDMDLGVHARAKP